MASRVRCAAICAAPAPLWSRLSEVRFNLLATRTGRLQIRRRIAPDFGLATRAAVDLVPQCRQARRQLRAVHGRSILLRPVELPRLERAGLAVPPFSDIEEDDMGVQLGRGVPVDGPRTVVLEGGRNPLPRRLGRVVWPMRA